MTLSTPTETRRERVTALMHRAQDELVQAFEDVDGKERFREQRWERPGGGGGRARVIEGGAVFERGGVNVSAVHGARVPESLAQQHPGVEGLPFFATGVSMVLHPRNPYVPAFHANYRYFEVGDATRPSGVWWFGGGADMTPSYPFVADGEHFHGALKRLCDRHPVADYATWKQTCDDYFTVRHRGEMRGIGGIFFDEITPAGRGDFEEQLAFVEDGIATLLPSYLPVVERRKDAPYGERERAWQAIRRGRYVEFNLVYDRGTAFGLQTGGNIEAILMSMPPLASWRFDYRPEHGSSEEAALAFYQPRDWVGTAGDRGLPASAPRDAGAADHANASPPAGSDMFHVKRRNP